VAQPSNLAQGPLRVLLIGCLGWLGACQQEAHEEPASVGEAIPATQPEVSDTTTPPQRTPADEEHAGVFQPLDGEWRGVFRVYVDPGGQAEQRPNVEDLDPADWEGTLSVSLEIDVRQRYVSESPYFQRVEIEDTYDQGGPRTVRSTGINKVQEGRLWCVVVKPDETVVHEGLDGGHDAGTCTITWSRDERDPLRVEAFHETVSAETYEIVGWGLYGEDDPELGPRTYFHGVYRRER
jgi:hypothetical protein